jgi:hypothetical protein
MLDEAGHELARFRERARGVRPNRRDLERLVPAFEFPIRLGIVRRRADVRHARHAYELFEVARDELRDDCPSELAAFVDLWTDMVWLMTKPEVAELAQQHSSGRYHLYMWADRTVRPRTGKRSMRDDFDSYLLETRVARLLSRPALLPTLAAWGDCSRR